MNDYTAYLLVFARKMLIHLKSSLLINAEE